jgi:hypothetical protein
MKTVDTRRRKAAASCVTMICIQRDISRRRIFFPGFIFDQSLQRMRPTRAHAHLEMEKLVENLKNTSLLLQFSCY